MRSQVGLRARILFSQGGWTREGRQGVKPLGKQGKKKGKKQENIDPKKEGGNAVLHE